MAGSPVPIAPHGLTKQVVVRSISVAFSWPALRKTARIALVVGTILSAVNQGSIVASGAPSVGTWLRIAVNYVTPFCVSTAGYLAARTER